MSTWSSGYRALTEEKLLGTQPRVNYAEGKHFCCNILEMFGPEGTYGVCHCTMQGPGSLVVLSRKQALTRWLSNCDIETRDLNYACFAGTRLADQGPPPNG